MTNWKELAEKHSEEMIQDISDMIKIPSVREDDKATADAPLGPGPKDALLKMMEKFERDGFKHENLSNIVGFAEYGTEESDDNYVAVLGHVDVMPGGDGWDTDPFEPIIKDGRLYGRGSIDDKGPSLAAYYGLKIVKELGLPLKHKIRFIIGTDEENEWTGMDHYFKTQPEPLLGFSPDAEYPIINGEKGLGQFEVHFTASKETKGLILNEFTSGLRTNMVPGKATATIIGGDMDEMEEQFNQFILSEEGLTGSAQQIDGNLLLILNGKQAHGAMPEQGINAGTFLAEFLSDYDFEGDANYFLELVGEKAHQDPEGQSMGIAFEDSVMGKLSFNIGIMRFVNGGPGMVNVNIRYPKGTTGQELEAKLNEVLDPEWGVAFEQKGHNQEPHYVAPTDSVVKTLLDIYHEQTGRPSYDQVIGGGTYGRLMKRGVAFGALFEDREDTMHQANEYIMIEDLIISASMYAQAIYELGNLD